MNKYELSHKITKLTRYINYINAGKNLGKCNHIDLQDQEFELCALKRLKEARYGR